MSEDSDTDEFESELSEAFSEAGASEDEASEAAGKAAAFREDFAEDLTVQDVLDALESAPYDDFGHDFDFAIGALADDNEDCTDSREYRLTGFGEIAADPTLDPKEGV